MKKRKPKRGRRKRRPRSRAQKGRGALGAYANMVSNPCTAILKPGFFGSAKGYLAKVKSTSRIGALPDGVSAGYVLWVPVVSSNGDPKPSPDQKDNSSLTRAYNIMVYTAEASTDAPTNTLVSPAFSSPGLVNGGTGSFLPDPAAQLIASTANQAGLMQDMRTVSACIRMSYTGRMDRSSGQMAFVENVPLSTILGHTSGASLESQPISIDQLFNLSPAAQRLGVDTLEVVWRPSAENPATFVGESDHALYTSTDEFLAPLFPTQIGDYANSREPTVFGFAWRGALESQLAFEFFKNVEWRPRFDKGFTAQIPRAINDHDYTGDVLKFLDELDPSWTRRILDASQSATSRIISAAFAGTAGLSAMYGRRRGQKLLY